eukprot:2931651-Alexandrium_andersonii.AAC.1
MLRGASRAVGTISAQFFALCLGHARPHGRSCHKNASGLAIGRASGWTTHSCEVAPGPGGRAA